MSVCRRSKNFAVRRNKTKDTEARQDADQSKDTHRKGNRDRYRPLRQGEKRESVFILHLDSYLCRLRGSRRDSRRKKVSHHLSSVSSSLASRCKFIWNSLRIFEWIENWSSIGPMRRQPKTTIFRPVLSSILCSLSVVDCKHFKWIFSYICSLYIFSSSNIRIDIHHLNVYVCNSIKQTFRNQRHISSHIVTTVLLVCHQDDFSLSLSSTLKTSMTRCDVHGLSSKQPIHHTTPIETKT